jgi:hypothetical protein
MYGSSSEVVDNVNVGSTVDATFEETLDKHLKTWSLLFRT